LKTAAAAWAAKRMLLWRGDAALLQQLSLGQWQWSLLADS